MKKDRQSSCRLIAEQTAIPKPIVQRKTVDDKNAQNITRIADILKKDRQSLCRLIAEQTAIPKPIVQQILLEDLQKRKLCMWFVPHTLTAK